MRPTQNHTKAALTTLRAALLAAALPVLLPVAALAQTPSTPAPNMYQRNA